MSSGDAVGGIADLMAKTSVEEAVGLLSFASRGLKLDDESDAKEIVAALKSFKNLKILELKGNTLGIKAAEAVGEGLKLHPTFERALWSDLFTGRGKSEIPVALKHLCNGIMGANACLVELDLSDNAFGPNGMVGLVDFLRSPSCYTLQELRLNNNGLGIQGGKMLADSLLACYESSVSCGKPLALRVFVSGRGRLEDEGATALAQAFKAMKSLEEVHMPQNGINHKGITALAEAFQHNPKMKHLNLSDNTFTEIGSLSMSRSIPKLQELEVINFEDCLMRTKGVKALAKAIKDAHKNLRVLKLSGNETSKSGAECVVEAIIHKEHFETLELNANQLGEDGVESVKGMMESFGKLGQLGSLSDDEGEEDEDDESDDEDDDDDDDDETDEDDDDSEDGESTEEEEEEEEEGQKTDGKANSLTSTPTAGIKAPTPEEFLQFPSPTKLQQIGEDSSDAFLGHIGNVEDEPERAIEAFIKISLVVVPSDEKTKQVATKFADAIMLKLFHSVKPENESRIVNELLVRLGLLKSEDKKFRPPSNLQGPFTVLEHVVRQSYFPKSMKSTLSLFISKSNSSVDNSSEARKSLLQALSS